MKSEEVNALTDEELQVMAAGLRGIRRMSPQEIAEYYSIDKEDAEKANERWIWDGIENEMPPEMAINFETFSAPVAGSGWIISACCPNYIRGMAWWELARELSPKKRQECMLSWHEAPRRITRAFIVARTDNE